MTKRKQIMALLAGILLFAGVAGTFAWLSVTGVLVNEFGFGSVKPSVDETLKDNVKSDVAISNKGTAPAYLRVAVDIYWQDQNGARLWDEPVEGTDYAVVWGDKVDAAATNSPSSWVLASDGFYYWTSPVAPMDKTGVLIKSVSETKTDGKNLVVDDPSDSVHARRCGHRGMGLYGQRWRAGTAARRCVSMAFPIRKDAARSLRCMVVAILCMVALAVPAHAFADTPAIAYDGNARQLTVSGATASSGKPDLFPAFKDLMPGDEREQQIEIRATGVKSQVRVFVRAVVDHETASLLSPITLTATVGDASAGWLQTGTPGSVFAYPTQVATFTGDGGTMLNLQLSVPTSVGNELADANKTIRWEITAEDDGEKIPARPAGTNKPGLLGLAATGDSTLALLLTLLTLAIIAFMAAMFLSRRNKR